ncbi:MAG: hypothetical protein K6U02_08475 [Firmicutes bacterium]|nr:hypothetical protein [Bacillota bacterium]
MLWWILGLLLASVVLLGLGIFLVGQFMIRQIQITQSPTEVEVHTPVGDIRMTQDERPVLDLPVYPKARLVDAPATVELSPPDADPVFITTAKYRTDDPPSAVDAWYQEQLGNGFEREGPSVMVHKKEVFGVEIRSDDVLFLAKEAERMRAVVIQKKGLATEIALLHIGKSPTL